MVRTFARRAELLVKVYVAGEDSPVVGTPEHPFYVRVHRAQSVPRTAEGGDEAGEWVAAGELGSGDEVLRADGGWAAVTGVEAEERAEAVYNFEVADNHNYFVGSQGALVHNNCDVATLLANHYGKLESILNRRGAQWGFTGVVNRAQIEAFAHVIAGHVQNAGEVWQASYREAIDYFILMGIK